MQSGNMEKYFLDALDRVAKNPFGYGVLYVKVSKLKPENRPPEFAKILSRLFDGVIGSKGSTFFLSNGDFAILSKDIPQLSVDKAVREIRESLSKDPVFSLNSHEDFVHVYHFPEDLNSFYKQIEKLQREGLIEEAAVVKRPIEASEIDRIILELNRLDIVEMVKRQSVMRLSGKNNYRVMFQEFFVAVKDLRLKFDSNLDLTANRWLFLYLTETLDKKALNSLAHSDLKKWPRQVGINLNLSSVFSKEFERFSEYFPRSDDGVIVEVKLMDVFNNLDTYFKAKEFLNKHGHKILIDDMDPPTVQMLDVQKLAPDMVKMFWDPLLEDGIDDDELKAAIDKIGRDNVILAKCDSEKAVSFGTAHGISAFQGPYIDNIEVEIIRERCPHASKCTTLQCLKRKRLLLGAFRDECMHKDILEDLL